jgi:hypothetical protein
MQGEQRGNFSGFRHMLKSAKVRVRHTLPALGLVVDGAQGEGLPSTPRERRLPQGGRRFSFPLSLLNGPFCRC